MLKSFTVLKYTTVPENVNRKMAAISAVVGKEKLWYNNSKRR